MHIPSKPVTLLGCLVVLVSHTVSANDEQFEQLGAKYIDEFAAFSPVYATELGDHRFDGQLDELSSESRKKQEQWIRRNLKQLKAINPQQLSRNNQVDYVLLRHALQARLWRLTELREWSWNPLFYTRVTGSSIYALMARDFAPKRERLNNAALRLEQFPRYLQQVRETLEVEKVPALHAKTATGQNRGVLKILENMVQPELSHLPEAERERLVRAMKIAEQAINKHQTWLENTLVPGAKGRIPLGIEQYETKLRYTLHSPLTRREIRELAETRVESLHRQMYGIAIEYYSEANPKAGIPKEPTKEFRRKVIRFGLELAYQKTPGPNEIVQTAKDAVKDAAEFIKREDLLTIHPVPLEIITMPEFQRGVSLAYCDAPGPLDRNQKTFYAVSPIPKNWSQKQIRSHLREYNTRSVDVLTIHEAMPGHFLQLSHANRYPGKLRHLLQSGTFVEGWACYTEGMMFEEGYRKDDPLHKLITLKWYLRDATNALLDQAVHVDGISEGEAMRLMTEDAFQEEREAAGKWVRAQLTSAQLSTYFVGWLEHKAMRRAAEKQWGDRFQLKTYHDQALSFGSPPPQFVEALLLERKIPGISETSEEN